MWGLWEPLGGTNSQVLIRANAGNPHLGASGFSLPHKYGVSTGLMPPVEIHHLDGAGACSGCVPVCPAVGSPVSPLFNQQQKESRTGGFVAGHHVGCAQESLLAKNLCPTRCSFTSGRAEALSPGGMQWVPGVTETPASGCARCIIVTSSSQHKLNKDMRWPWSMLPPPAPLLVPCLVPASQWWSTGYSFLAIMTNMTPRKSRIME